MTVVISGRIDHDRIAAIAGQVQPQREVLIDLTHADGPFSTIIAACIQVTTVSSRPVLVRGCSRRFATTLHQMHLDELIHLEAGPDQA